ncbi:hypothetical protein D3C85_524110 [compost metagenome]
MTTYIYGLYCPVADAIRYVGKSDDPVNRLTSHLSAAKGSYYEHHTCRWLKKILRAGHVPRLVYLQEVDNTDCWKQAERNWIIRARDLGWPITNTAEGGQGVTFPTEQDEARFCAAVKAGVNTPKELARRGEDMRQRHQDPVYRAKVAKAMADPEMIKRRGESIKAARNTLESKAKTSAQAKAQHADPAYKANHSASIKAKRSSPESRAKTSAQMLERWAKKKAQETVEVPTDPLELKRFLNKQRQAAYDKRRRLEKAAKLAATTSAPYTESS